MSRPLQRNALRRIQDIVPEAMGSLASLARGDLSDAAGRGFSHREVTILFADLRGCHRPL